MLILKYFYSGPKLFGSAQNDFRSIVGWGIKIPDPSFLEYLQFYLQSSSLDPITNSKLPTSRISNYCHPDNKTEYA